MVAVEQGGVARRVEAFERIARLNDEVAREVDGAAVVRREHEQAHGLGVELLHDVAHGEEVARGLGHLLVVHVDVAVVHPVFGKRLARRALGLGDLVFVVREDEVHAAAVDVKRLAEVLHAHGRALDVPAGTAHAPRALPRRLAGLLRLPEGKVHGMALYVPHLHARTALQIV